MPLSASTSSAALSTRRRACSPRRRGPGCEASGGVGGDDEALASPGERLWVTVFPSLDRDAIVPMTDRYDAVSIGRTPHGRATSTDPAISSCSQHDHPGPP